MKKRLNTPSSCSASQKAYHYAHFKESKVRAILWKVLADYLSSYIPPDAHVVELGAGYCYWINEVRAARKVAVDIWSELPRYAGADVEPIQHDLLHGLQFLGGQTFDVVMASNVLEHLEADVAAQLVSDVFNSLRAGGRFIVIQPNFRYAYRCYFDDYTHRSIFTDVSLPNLMRVHGFNIECLRAKFMPYSLRETRLPVRSWLISAYLHSPLKPFAGQMLVVGKKP
jgi:SAM-dependent methyltransferase